MTDKKLAKYGLYWGFILWLIGFVLGIALFPVVPTALIGYYIMPIGTLITVWVLWKKIKLTNLKDYFILAVFWTLIAIICDYIFLVRLLNPADGYYKFDVFIYYMFTFFLPIIMGLRRQLTTLQN